MMSHYPPSCVIFYSALARSAQDDKARARPRSVKQRSGPETRLRKQISAHAFPQLNARINRKYPQFVKKFLDRA